MKRNSDFPPSHSNLLKIFFSQFFHGNLDFPLPSREIATFSLHGDISPLPDPLKLILTSPPFSLELGLTLSGQVLFSLDVRRSLPPRFPHSPISLSVNSYRLFPFVS